MNLFSEIYNCYYQIVYHLLSSHTPLTKDAISDTITSMGYAESVLYLIPKLTKGNWNFFNEENHTYLSKMDSDITIPLTNLQKSWLKALLLDRRIRLFLSEEQLQMLQDALQDISPLFYPEDFYYYDAFSNGDHYESPAYQNHFRIILAAMEKKQYLNIEYQSHHNHRIHHWFLPCRLEYSIKNDCFRLLALEVRNHSHYHFFTINLSRIAAIEPLDYYAKKTPNINRYLKRSYHKEPVTLLIRNERNALERTMLQFANYQKNTTKIGDNLYQCEIYYNKSNETELLIEVLSFGPMVKVIGNEHFLKQIKTRLSLQKQLLEIKNS